MIIYVLFDSNEIIGTFDSLLDAFHHYLTTIDIVIKYNNNIEKIISNMRILEYNNNLIKEIYTIKNSNLYSSTDKIIIFDQIGIKNLLNKIFNNQNIIDESEMKLFIPLADIRTEIINDTKNTPSKLNLNELKEIIKKLEYEKENELKNIDNLKNDYETKEEKYIEKLMKVQESKLSIMRKKDKQELIQKKFDADQKLYLIFKTEIETGKRDIDDIPILFKEIYPIFVKIEEENIVNKQEILFVYETLIKKIDYSANEDYKELFEESDELSFYCNNDKNL